MSVVALLGLPNSGKSTLFNTLTKSRQRVANFPGITVEKKLGTVVVEGKSINVVDLPGIYTLDVSTLDEKVTRDYVFNKVKGEKADIIVLVVDATNLKKSIYLALQLQEVGKKFVVALNMMDIAKKRGQELDLNELSHALGNVSIIPIVAIEGEGIDQLLRAVCEEKQVTDAEVDIPADFQKQIKDPKYIKEKFDNIEKIIKDVTVKEIEMDSLTEKVDSFLLHPFMGPIILIVLLVFIFQLLFAWSDPFMGMIEDGFSFLGSIATGILPEGLLQSLVVDGIIAGVGGIMVFLPHIIFLFMIIYFLEDVGYLGRAAFMLDYLMRKLGLPGKAVVPMLSSHACAIPGIMSARIIENHHQRLITMMVAPLTTCSARLPVYTLLIGIMIPANKYVFGFLGMQGLVLAGLYLFGMSSAFIVAFVAKKALTPRSPSYLLMELPPYRVPKLWNLTRSSLQKGWIFVKKAGSVILVLSIIIWGLVTFPKPPADFTGSPIEYSAAARIGKTFQPLFSPLGFDWKITTALIPSFAAREVLVAAMGTVYAVDGDDPEDDGFIGSLSKVMGSRYTLGTLMALLVWFVFSPQCIATFGVLRRETGGYKMPLIFGAYTLVLAYLFAWLAYLVF